MTDLSSLNVAGIPTLGAGGGLPTTPGKYIFVDYGAGSDGNTGETMKEPVKTIAQAYSMARTNKDDTLVLIGNSTHTITSMIDGSKNRVHLVGLDCTNRLYGQNAKISMGVTTAATDVFGFKDTGVRTSFANIKFMSSNTKTEHVATFGGGGEYTKFTNCEFYASGKQASDTHAEFVHNIDSPQFSNCTFGSLATAVTGNKIRPAMLLTKGTVAAGAVARDTYMHNCRFWKLAGGTATAMIKGASNDVERDFELHDCQFVAAPLGSTPAVAIDSGTQARGYIRLTGDTAATNCTKIATDIGVFNVTPARAATATIGIQAT